MTNDTATWVVAALELVAAVGIAIYWVTWFRANHTAEWLPPGYVEHEAPFVFSDSALALVLLAAAGLQIAEEPLGESLGLIAAGMMVFLGILDLAYFARTGLFRRDRNGPLNAALVAGTLTLAAILIVRFA